MKPLEDYLPLCKGYLFSHDFVPLAIQSDDERKGIIFLDLTDKTQRVFYHAFEFLMGERE